MRLLVASVFLMVSTYCLGSAIDVYDFESDTDLYRYQTLVDELRCPKCQNQNLKDSNSQIAIDLRGEVARMVLEGHPDETIIDFMVDRYGDFVLYRPPVQGNTIALWMGPAVMFLLGGLVLGWIIYRRTKAMSDLDEEGDDIQEDGGKQ